jgi:hypothetical protein
MGSHIFYYLAQWRLTGIGVVSTKYEYIALCIIAHILVVAYRRKKVGIDRFMHFTLYGLLLFARQIGQKEVWLIN